MTQLLLSLSLSVLALAPSAPTTRRSSTASVIRHRRPCMAAGELLRLAIGVADVSSSEQFYTAGLGLSSAPGSDGSVLVGGAEGPRLELRERTGATYDDTSGFQGLSLRVPSVASAVAAATKCGGTVLSDPEQIEHGPSWKPVDEPDDMRNEILEAVVADPCGYPVLLHEAEDAAVGISGVRCECHVWKTSQEWYESLGWRMLRFNSNVHREGSLTVTMGSDADAPNVGPRGGASGGVLQLTYVYGSSPVRQAGFEEIVLGAGTRELAGEIEELHDPDGYKIRLER